MPQICRHQLLQPDKGLLLHPRLVAASRLGSAAHRNQLRQRIGNLDSRKMLFAFAGAQHDGEIQTQVRDVRKRASWVEGKRRQRGKNCLLEIGIHRGALLFRQIGIVLDVDARSVQGRHKLLGPAVMGAAEQAYDGGADGAQLFRRRHAIGTRLAHAFFNLPLQPGHAHHEELVNVGADEGQEHQPLQHRIAAVLRFFQHPPLEVHQAQLAVDVERGIVERSRSLSAVMITRVGSRRCPGRDTSAFGRRGFRGCTHRMLTHGDRRSL